MVKRINSDIPKEKFAEVTIGNNGVRITQNRDAVEIGNGLAREKTPVSIYLSSEDIMEIFSAFFASSSEKYDGIETIYLDASSEKNSDEIVDANY